jgi:hypothetical protein
MSTNTTKITISSISIPQQELQSLLEEELKLQKLPINLQLETDPHNTRSIDPTILVALVTASGVVLSALINGLILVAQTKNQEKLILQGRNGARLEIPVNTPSKKIDEYIDKLKQIDVEHIHIASK